MISTQNPNPTFLKNIEEAIKDQGTLACPDFECNSKLISKKIMTSDGGTFLEYNCENQDCSFHNKRKIPIESEPNIRSKFNFKFTQDQYLLIFGIALLSIFSYTGYNLFQINSYLESETKTTSEQPAVQKKLSTTKDFNSQKEKITSTQND